MNIYTASTIRYLMFVTILGSALAASTVHAQAADTSTWVCEFCPFADGYSANFELGASSVSEDSAYFGNASGYSDAGVYANIDATGNYASDDHRLRWTIEDLGLDSRFAELTGGRQGRFDYRLAYREIPKQQFFTTNTIFEQTATDFLSLPQGWVAAASTSGFSALDANLKKRNIESERKFIEIGGRYLQSTHLRFSADYRRQEHQGVDIHSGASFSQSSQMARPIDYTTDEVDLNIRYSGTNGYLSLAWYLSDFDNAIDAFTWESPFTTTPGAELQTQARAPDNRFQQLSLSGSYRFPQHRTVIAFSSAFGQIKQDQDFLPYTSNLNLNASALPRNNLDGQVDTTNLAISLTSNALKKVRVKLAYRYDERDNQTAIDLWNRIVVDTFTTAESVSNTPYSFERSSLNLSADYDLFKTVRVSGGYDRKTIDRTFQEVAGQTEDSGWGRLRWRPNRALQIDIKGGSSERDIDGNYDENLAVNLGQNPLLRKFNLAYRYREFAELSIALSPSGTPITITVDGYYADDDYSRSQLGITSGENFRLSTDLGWTLSNKASLYLTGGYENVDSTQVGSELQGQADWRSATSDDFYTLGGGIRIKQIGDKLDLQLDYTRSQGSTEINVTTAATGLSQFPDLKSTLDYLRLKLTYQKSEKLELSMNLRYQRFSADDWALVGVSPSTIPTVLTLGAQEYNDEMLIVGLSFQYRVGESL